MKKNKYWISIFILIAIILLGSIIINILYIKKSKSDLKDKFNFHITLKYNNKEYLNSYWADKKYQNKELINVLMPLKRDYNIDVKNKIIEKVYIVNEWIENNNIYNWKIGNNLNLNTIVKNDSFFIFQYIKKQEIN